MTPIEPLGLDGFKRLLIGENQEEDYTLLPALISPEGMVCTEWELTEEEMQRLICGGRLRILMQTFNRPLQPLKVDILEPVEPGVES